MVMMTINGQCRINNSGILHYYFCVSYKIYALDILVPLMLYGFTLSMWLCDLIYKMLFMVIFGAIQFLIISIITAFQKNVVLNPYFWS